MCAKLRPLPTGEDEIMTKGEGIYKTIVTAIPCLLGTSVIFVFPVGTSFIFSHILCVRKKTNLLVAWVMSFFVIPVTFAGLYFSRFSFELLYRYLFLLLLIIILLSLFYSKAKWIIAIVSLYSLYFAELYFLEILVAVQSTVGTTVLLLGAGGPDALLTSSNGRRRCRSENFRRLRDAVRAEADIRTSARVRCPGELEGRAPSRPPRP